MLRPALRLLVTLPLIALALACNAGGPTAPPDAPPAAIPQGSITDPLPEGLRTPGTGLEASLALTAGSIDFDHLAVTLEPARALTATGDAFDLDATDFFMYRPCSDCVRVEGISRTPEGHLRLDINLRHPFQANSGRLDLLVFDVRGILIVPGTTAFPGTTADLDGDGTTAPTETLSGNVDLVLNADGYTTRFDARAEDAAIWGAPKNIAGTINPFRRYFVDPSVPSLVPASPVGHNVMGPGMAQTQTWVLKPPAAGGSIPFVFVVDAAYGAAGYRHSPSYWLPEFNRKEAWEVSAQVTANALMAANVNSTASLTIYAKDWQQNAVVAPSWPATNSSQVRAPSRVAKVLIDVPGLMAPMERTTPTGGQGSDSFPLRYEVTVYNELAAPEGTYTALVAVRDELSVSPGGGPLPLPAGITRGTPLDIRDYTTYITVPLEVAAASGAELADPLPYPIIFATTEPVTWPGSIAATTGNFGYAPTGDPGTGNLWRLDPDGTLTNLTSFYRAVVRRPMISYDGTRIAFSAKIGDGSAPWQVYTMDLDGQNLSNLSRNSHNDFDPDWLPDGRLVFCSDRIPNWNDPYALTQTAQLFTMDSDGRNVERLTYSPSGDYWPVVLRDGRISFRRWDNLRINIERHSGPLHGVPYGFPENFGMNDINGGNIWVCNPDGTNVDLHYGSHLTRNRRTFNDHTELPDGRMLAIAAPFSDTWGAGTVALLDPAEYDNVEVPFYWTEPEAAAPGPAATGRYRFPAALADGRAVAVYAPGPLYYTGTPFEPDFGLVLITQTGEKRALVDQPGVWEWSPVEARPRPTPATIPAIDNPDQNWGLLACGNVFLRDAREPESKDPQPIPPVAPGYKVRFYQGVISDSVGLFDPPAPAMPVLRPHRYLGEAPVASDGSFAAMLPAHQPITWQLVNAQNKVVVTERFYTSLEGGETRTCQGCHAPQRPGAFVPRNPTEFVALENPTDLR